MWLSKCNIWECNLTQHVHKLQVTHIWSDGSLSDRPKLFALKLTYVSCKNVFSNVIITDNISEGCKYIQKSISHLKIPGAITVTRPAQRTTHTRRRCTKFRIFYASAITYTWHKESAEVWSELSCQREGRVDLVNKGNNMVFPKITSDYFIKIELFRRVCAPHSGCVWGNFLTHREV